MSLYATCSATYLLQEQKGQNKADQAGHKDLKFYDLIQFLFCCCLAGYSMDRQNDMPSSTLKHVPNRSPGPCSKVELIDVPKCPGVGVIKLFSF